MCTLFARRKRNAANNFENFVQEFFQPASLVDGVSSIVDDLILNMCKLLAAAGTVRIDGGLVLITKCKHKIH